MLLRPTYRSTYFSYLEGVSRRHCAVGDFASVVAAAATAGEYWSLQYLCLAKSLSQPASSGRSISYAWVKSCHSCRVQGAKIPMPGEL